MDEKAYKFKKLAEKRTSDVIKRIRMLGNLSNKSNYKYDHDQVLQIVDALQKEIKEMEKKFDSGTTSDDTEFKFRD